MPVVLFLTSGPDAAGRVVEAVDVATIIVVVDIVVVETEPVSGGRMPVVSNL